MSDFGADVFDQDRPKVPTHRTPTPRDERPSPLPPPAAKSAPVPAARTAVAPTRGSRREDAAPAMPAAAPPREAPPAREREVRIDRPESPWATHEARREPAARHRRQEVPHREAHKERHTQFRPAHHREEPRQRERAEVREPVRPIEGMPSQRAPATRAVCLLVDLEGLQAEARAQQGELALHRLRSGLGSGRTVARAVAIAKNAGTPPSGFDLLVATGGFSAGVQFASAALDLLQVAPTLVMAPVSDPIRRLATALRAAGHSVELAGFAEAADATSRRLGRECLFVP